MALTYESTSPIFRVLNTCVSLLNHEQIPLSNKPKTEDTFLNGVVEKLRNTSCFLGHECVFPYKTIWQEKMQIVVDFLMGKDNPFSGIQAAANLMVKKIAIPFLIENFFLKHIVVFVIDREQKKLYYYDSKGETLEKNASLTIDGSSLTIDMLKKHILSTYSLNDEQVEENTKAHQKDIHNCGVFVLYFLKLIQESTHFASVLEQIHQKNPFEMRKELIEELLSEQSQKALSQNYTRKPLLTLETDHTVKPKISTTLSIQKPLQKFSIKKSLEIFFVLFVGILALLESFSRLSFVLSLVLSLVFSVALVLWDTFSKE